MTSPLTLSVLPGRFGVCRLAGDAPLPVWARGGPFSSITRTADELSVICVEDAIPDQVTHDGGWRGLRVHGPLDLSQVGVLASIASALAAAGIGMLAVATHDTDYVFVRDDAVEAACQCLVAAGHRVVD